MADVKRRRNAVPASQGQAATQGCAPETEASGSAQAAAGYRIPVKRVDGLLVFDPPDSVPVTTPEQVSRVLAEES